MYFIAVYVQYLQMKHLRQETQFRSVNETISLKRITLKKYDSMKVKVHDKLHLEVMFII